MSIKDRIKNLIRKYLKSFIPEIFPDIISDILPVALNQYYLPEGWQTGYGVYSHVLVDNRSLVHIGEGSFLNHRVGLYVGSGSAEITIGKNVFIANDSIITTCSHEIGPSEKKSRPCYI